MKWCLKCQQNISDPGTSSIAKYKMYWEDNKCYHCGCLLNNTMQSKTYPDAINHQQENIPRCPTCQSTRIERITTGSKVGKAVLFGVFALGKISKTFKCNNCGYQW